METVSEDAPKLDVSTLIDVCFLLLIYFLVATTLVQEQKLDMSIPGESVKGTPPPLDPANVRVDSSGGVYWGVSGSEIKVESDPNERELNGLYEQLNTLRTTAEGMGTTPIVLLLIRNDVPNQRVVDVMNALSRARIKSVGLADVKED